MSRSNLSAVFVKTVSTPGRYGDGGNLWLQVSKRQGRIAELKAGTSLVTKCWLFRYMRNGKQRSMGLGSATVVTLAQAREKATACSLQLAEGIDPIDARQVLRQGKKLTQARTVTFKHCAEKYIAAHEAGWKSPKHRSQWDQSLELHVYPILGDLSVFAIDTGLVMQVLEPIWSKRPKTADRIRGRIERILSYAKVRGFREGDNPAQWRGHLDQLLPPIRRVATLRHHPALPYQEIYQFLLKLREREWLSSPCIEFLILTVTRSGEARGARWDEIDLSSKIWTIPASRMKGNREHRIPLSARAVELLADLPRIPGESLVFIGGGLTSPCMIAHYRRRWAG